LEQCTNSGNTESKVSVDTKINLQWTYRKTTLTFWLFRTSNQIQLWAENLGPFPTLSKVVQNKYASFYVSLFPIAFESTFLASPHR